MPRVTVLTVDGTTVDQPLPFTLFDAVDTSGGWNAIRRSMLRMVETVGEGFYCQQDTRLPDNPSTDGLTVYSGRSGVFHICPRAFWLPEGKVGAVIAAWKMPLQICHSWATLVDEVHSG